MDIQAHSALSKRNHIVDMATDVAKMTHGKPYVYGGKTPAGFDCSGYVTYVYQRVFPKFPNGLSAADFQTHGFHTTQVPSPGDLVYFPAGRNSYDKKSYPDHVGIVLDATTWIGSQSSTGVAEVKMNNPWWNGRLRTYLKYGDIGE